MVALQDGIQASLAELLALVGDTAYAALGPDADRLVAEGLGFLRRRLTGDYGVDLFGPAPGLGEGLVDRGQGHLGLEAELVLAAQGQAGTHPRRIEDGQHEADLIANAKVVVLINWNQPAVETVPETPVANMTVPPDSILPASPVPLEAGESYPSDLYVERDFAVHPRNPGTGDKLVVQLGG